MPLSHAESKSHFSKPHYSVALEGFSAFERGALASFFRLAGQRRPSYVHVHDSGRSDFLIADADRPATLEAIQRAGRLEDTVFVGSHAPEGAHAWLGRPIDPMRIVRELDSLARRRAQAETAADHAGLDLRLLDIDLTITLNAAAPPAAAPLASGETTRDALVVDDSPLASRFLDQRLRRFGYRVSHASSGEQAIDMLARQAYTIVFVDLVLGPPGSVDGLQVCQHVRQRIGAPGGKATAVVMIGGSVTETERVRGLLAGCDAYLGKPLSEDEILATLRRVDPLFRGEAVIATA